MKLFVHTSGLEQAGKPVNANVSDSENPFRKTSIFGPQNILKAVDQATKEARRIRAAGGNPVLQLISRTPVSSED